MDVFTNLPLELRIALLSIVQKLDMEFAPGYARTWENDMKDFFVFQKGKLPVVCKPRSGA
jgi:hypothetical protein